MKSSGRGGVGQKVGLGGPEGVFANLNNSKAVLCLQTAVPFGFCPKAPRVGCLPESFEHQGQGVLFVWDTGESVHLNGDVKVRLSDALILKSLPLLGSPLSKIELQC